VDDATAVGVVEGTRDFGGDAHRIGNRELAVVIEAIAEGLALEQWQREAIELAACWHDIGRTNDGSDYYHGAKSAGRVVGLGLHVDQRVDPLILETALFMVTHHCGDEGHARLASIHLADPTEAWTAFKVLKDADALDRVRLGSGDLDPSLLRFPESRARIDRAWEMYRASGE